jgi:hypothetical protein
MKRLTAVALVLLLLICISAAYAAAPGSAGDPLISLSYINGTFQPAVRGDAKNLIHSAIGNSYGDTLKKLQEAYDGYMLRLGGMEGYTFAGSFTPLHLPAGKSARLITGGTFILTSGAASVQIEKGTVINISTGAEIPSGSFVTVNQRYFCAEDTTALFAASEASTCLVDGYYQSGGDVIVNPIPFTDVRTVDWFYPAVKFAYDNNLFKGTSPATFEPKTAMTRGMFVTVLYRLAGQPAVTSSAVFSDVPSNQYYTSAVSWANANNIVTGYEGKFMPGTLITREQMAVILYRYAVFAGFGAPYANTNAFDSFPDKASVSGYATEAVKWATYNGLLSGAGGKLMPNNTASRAEVAQIILNYCRKFTGI